MTDIEKLMSRHPDLTFYFEPMPNRMGGLNLGSEITINSLLSSQEQLQWLYEEIGHSQTSVGDISDYGIGYNIKQEKKARRWGLTHFISRDEVEKLENTTADSDYEVAEELGVQLHYLHEVGFIYGFSYKHISD